MGSIVLELQKEAINSKTEFSDLLRKAYLVAKKLKIVEFEKWIKLEQYGYKTSDTKVPEYRKIYGVLKYFNPVYGYSDFIIDDCELQEIASTRYLYHPIAEIEDIYNKSENMVVINLETKTLEAFRKYFINKKNFTNIIPEKLYVSSSQLKAILDSVRNIILDWSLQLEEDGILGEDLEFTSKEKEIAEEKSTNYINNIYDSIVQLGENNIQHISQINLDEVQKILNSIKSSFDEFKLDSNVKIELNGRIETLESQINSMKPDKVIIKESLKSIRNILEGCASSAIAPTLILAISKCIGI